MGKIVKSDNDEQLSLNQQLEALESLVNRLENPEIELEDALTVYEEGMAIASKVQKRLEAAEKRIAVVNSDGSMESLE